MGYKRTTAQEIELLKNFSECIKKYGGIRATFKELDKIPNGYSDNIDRLYSEAIHHFVANIKSRKEIE